KSFGVVSHSAVWLVNDAGDAVNWNGTYYTLLGSGFSQVHAAANGSVAWYQTSSGLPYGWTTVSGSPLTGQYPTLSSLSVGSLGQSWGVDSSLGGRQYNAVTNSWDTHGGGFSEIYTATNGDAETW